MADPPLRIALISPVFPPRGSSGIGSANFHHALGLRRLGHEVHVYTWLDDSPVSVTDVVEGVVVHRAANPVWARTGWRAVDKVVRTIWRWVCRDPALEVYGTVRAARSLLMLLPRLWRQRLSAFDLIEVCEWGGACAILGCGVRGPRTVVSIHGSLYSHAHHFASVYRLAPADVRLATAIERFGAVRADVRIAPSDVAAEDARAWLCPGLQVSVVRHSIDLPTVDRMAPPADMERVPGDEIRVVFLGHVTDLKGADIVDHAIGILAEASSGPSWRFWIAGPSSRTESYRHFRSGAHGRVTVEREAAVDYATVLRRLWESDILLAPSQAETFGMTVLEAMACRCAVVASPVGAVREMVENGVSGYLCDRQSEGAFVDALLSLANASTRERVVAAARRTVEQRYSSAEVARVWLEVVRTRGRDA